MKTRKWFGVGVVLLLLPAAIWAQAASNDVTFRVPLRLTNLSPNIRGIIVTCQINSLALTGGTARSAMAWTVYSRQFDAPSAGVKVAISSPIDISKSNIATYSCVLTGQNHASPEVRSEFAENHAVADFRLSPTPAPITGSFEWRPVTVAPSLGTTTSP